MEMIEVLRDMLWGVGGIERYFEGRVPVNLWLAKKIRDAGALFEIVDQEVVRPRGAPGKPDITIENGWVRVRNRPRGLSAFDQPNIFKGSWAYYKIPKATILPTGLAIVRD